MIQGWHKDEHLVLFEEQFEAIVMTERYDLERFLPGFTVVGLKNWDDFVIRDATRCLHTVPTVPLTEQFITPCTTRIESSELREDGRVAGRIKWYVKPIVFGGNPISEQNVVWITLDQHVDAVKWWNGKYRELRQTSNG